MADEGEGAGFPAGETRAAAPDSAQSAPANGAAARPQRVPGRGGLSDHTRKRIAAQLRTMYDTVAQQPVPDRFAELIARLDGGRENV